MGDNLNIGGEFRIHVDGLREVEEELGRLSAKSGDLTPLMKVIGDVLVAGTRDRFERGEGPDGTPWKPSLRAELEGGQTLLDSRQLHDSVHFEARSDQVEVGSNLIYAGVHQLGATIVPVNAGALHFKLPGGLGLRTVQQVVIPARPYLGVSDYDEDEIRGAVAIYAGAEA
ncbi:MAG: phage virion morphogenesis protein [Pseudomonadota bacterium]|nr:phage virion morphogenesis protein [Pseudomonadota bacterium]